MTAPNIPGQPHIAYQGNNLCMEGVKLSAVAAQMGTPVFAYSKASMLSALAAYQRGFEGRKVQICYAMKANSNLAVLQVFAKAGCGFDIVSAGELARVLAAGGEPSKIIFSGVGKTRAEMKQALELGIGCFNVESEAELEVLNEVALSLGKKAPVSLRVNPNVDPKTHPYISTGLKGNKFGVAHESALQTYQRAAQLPGLAVVGRRRRAPPEPRRCARRLAAPAAWREGHRRGAAKREWWPRRRETPVVAGRQRGRRGWSAGRARRCSPGRGRAGPGLHGAWARGR